MANPVLNSPTFAGELALPYIHAAVVSAPTLHGGNVTLLDGVRYKAVLPVMSFGTGDNALIKSGACDFDTTATTDLDERILEVTDLMVNLQLCKKQFRTWWQGDAYSTQSGVPDDYADALLLYVAKFVQADIEHNIWMGGATASGYSAFNGFKLGKMITEAIELKIADLIKAHNTELEKVKKLSATKTFKNTPKSENKTEVKTKLSQDERIFAIFNKIKNR